MNIILCLNNKQNCIGGKEAGNLLCKKGHIGPLCEECDLYSVFWNMSSYSKISASSFSCTNCKSINYNFVFLIFSLLWTFISTFLAI